MDYKTHLILLFVLISSFAWSQKPVARLVIVPPTIEQEASSIWRTINDITFFEKQGYRVYLPKGALIDSLLDKSKNGAFGNDDFRAIYEFLENKTFDPNDYQKARSAVEDEIGLLSRLTDQIATQKSDWDWEFKTFDTYRIVFTLYGTGGSYDPDNGTITLLTNKEGGFMKYQNPAYTIIHEIVHMGTEQSIVRKFNLSHGLKERIVDTIVNLMFREYLPEYEIQSMGNRAIDDYLQKKDDIASLNTILSSFSNK
ncbi:MAG: hypothetical protein HRT61_03475 [Ekhidna sp.]|nr:hypothetical protein [Ekhidna sp.]